MSLANIYTQRPWVKFYDPGVPADVDIPIKSVTQAFNEATEKWKNRPAVIFYGRKMSYGELRQKVDSLATALFRLGIKKGDRVAFLLLNCPQQIVAFFAVIKLGAVVTAISPVYVSSEIKHQLVDSGTDTIICEDMLYGAVQKTGIKLKNIILSSISEYLPRVRKYFRRQSILRSEYNKLSLPSDDIYKQEGFFRFQDLVKNNHPNPPYVEIDPQEDIMTLPYTGGTTGAPKGVMITHQNVAANLEQIGAFHPFLKDGEELWVAYMPFYHAFGQVMGIMNGILRGYTLLILTTPDPDDILNLLARYKVNYFFGAPAMYEILKDYKKTDRVNWKRIKMVVSGADALHKETAEQWKTRTSVTLHEGYGMTECTVLTHQNPLGKAKIGSVGVPVSGTFAAIIDLKTNDFCPVNERGEIAISGPQVTKGYFNNPDATNENELIIDGRRWWRTGDIGSMDDDGYFYIYDRKRDLIKYKGLRIYAREVEEVLKTHPKIKEAAVIGISDIKVGENIKAFIVSESDARGSLSEEEIISYCKDKLAPYKIPKTVEFVGEIPKTDVGKVSHRELREEVI